jgi:hypothetical protein
MNRLLILSLLLGGSLVSCSGEESTDTVDADLEVISEEAADAAAEAAIKTEDDAKNALDKLGKELDG